MNDYTSYIPDKGGNIPNMNVIICDDEQVYRASIEEKVNVWAKEHQHESAVMVYSFASSEDLLEEWERGLHFDMLFMDIQIPYETDGLKIAKTIFDQNENIPIAFITNYAEYACEGYLVNALRYILKPIHQQAIDDCMNIAWNRWVLMQSDSVRIEVGKQVELIPLQQILFVESYAHRLLFTTISGQRIDARGSIGQLANSLSKGLLGQCHKSYLVNVMYVRKLQADSLTLSNGAIIPIGRKYASEFYQLFNQYHQGRG
ncbi:MAG: response regulator transcription factor [Clostridia bacterium]|nr:response regulator transcription factor [Clostridia bacterium]